MYLLKVATEHHVATKARVGRGRVITADDDAAGQVRNFAALVDAAVHTRMVVVAESLVQRHLSARDGGDRALFGLLVVVVGGREHDLVSNLPRSLDLQPRISGSAENQIIKWTDRGNRQTVREKRREEREERRERRERDTRIRSE
jgi:hypothetical protein